MARFLTISNCAASRRRPNNSAPALQIAGSQRARPVSRNAVFVLQVRHNVIGALLLGIELSQHSCPVCDRPAGLLYNLLVTDFPMVCVQDMFSFMRAFSNALQVSH